MKVTTRKITLTTPQLAFLSRLVKQSLETTVNYPPARKLVDLGFATQATRMSPINGRPHPHWYSVTDAGRTHHQSLQGSGLEGSKVDPSSMLKDTPGGAPEARVTDTPDINSLSVGDVIWIQKSQARFKVTCIDRKVGEDGPLVELRKPSSTKTLYTLMRHAREPGTFVLSSSRTSRDIDGWSKVEGS